MDGTVQMTCCVACSVGPIPSRCLSVSCMRPALRDIWTETRLFDSGTGDSLGRMGEQGKKFPCGSMKGRSRWSIRRLRSRSFPSPFSRITSTSRKCRILAALKRIFARLNSSCGSTRKQNGFLPCGDQIMRSGNRASRAPRKRSNWCCSLLNRRDSHP